MNLFSGKSCLFVLMRGFILGFHYKVILPETDVRHPAPDEIPEKSTAKYYPKKMRMTQF